VAVDHRDDNQKQDESGYGTDNNPAPVSLGPLSFGIAQAARSFLARTFECVGHCIGENGLGAAST
jgi:hypothetical protein